MHNKPHSEDAKAKMSAARQGKPNFANRRETREVDGVTLYKCGRCGDFYPKDGFYRNNRTVLGIKNECRACHNRTSIRSRNIDAKREMNREHMRRAKQRDPEKFRERARVAARNRPDTPQRRARYLLNSAVSAGAIQRPDRCEICGRADLRIEGHHDDYARPLEVRWLCSECHGIQHRK